VQLGTGVGTGYQAVVTMIPRATSILLSSVLVLWACGAPRDPALEKAVLLARKAKAEAPAEAEPAPPPPLAKAAPERPLKRYSGGEIATILAAVPGSGELRATFETALGPITCRLDERAPQTVANFVGLALGQLEWRADDAPPRARPLYDGLSFHRIVQDFIIQAGNPTGSLNAGPGWRIAREQGANDLFGAPGAIAMVEEEDGSHGSQFFIMLKADRGQGDKRTAFGRCEQLDLVRQIANAEKKARSDGKAPANPVTIIRVVLDRVP